MPRLDKVTIKGFRSMEALDDFALGNTTILIGSNGAGKSNFIELFRLLRNIADESFQTYAQQTGSENLFHHGPNRTSTISFHLEFGSNIYELDLIPKAGGGVIIGEERGKYTGGKKYGMMKMLGGSSPESCLKRRADEPGTTGSQTGVPHYIFGAISSWTVYHVHDTNPLAPMRGWSSVSNNMQLSHDAGNLGAVLLRLRGEFPDSYRHVRDVVRLAAPFFDDFVLRPQPRGPEIKVAMEWTQRGSPEPFQATVLSDGTIRFIALVVALLQPMVPSTIVIDEPELGLHPSAISLLGETIRSTDAQVVVATQSPLLLDGFEPDDVVVVERDNGSSALRRLSSDALHHWLDDYSLGQLWTKNVIGGRP